MNKLKSDIKNLKDMLKLIDTIQDKILCLNYYSTSQDFESNLEKEEKTIICVLDTLENMQLDKENLLLEEDEDE